VNLKIKKFRKYQNSNGSLTPFYIDKSLNNFKIKRFFFVYGKINKKRGFHAHKKCNQIYIPILGNIFVSVISKKNKRKKILLNKDKKKFLFVPKMHWTEISFNSNKNILLVLCDYRYDRKEYIENKKVFLNS
jgi:dTDP-4-dehydrorhamnose 3,5-epimerase-like enzyme